MTHMQKKMPKIGARRCLGYNCGITTILKEYPMVLFSMLMSFALAGNTCQIEMNIEGMT